MKAPRATGISRLACVSTVEDATGRFNARERPRPPPRARALSVPRDNTGSEVASSHEALDFLRVRRAEDPADATVVFKFRTVRNPAKE